MSLKRAGTIGEAMERFLRHEKTEVSEATCSHREWSLRRLGRFLEEEGVVELGQLTVELMTRYEREKPATFKGLKSSTGEATSETLRGDTVNIRAFLRFLYHQELILEDLSWQFSPVSVPSRLPKPLSSEIIEEWFSLCDLTTPCGMRDRAFFEVAYGVGLRPGENLSLKLFDIDLGQGQIMVDKSKTDEPRLVPMTRTVHRYLSRYLAEARPHFPRHPDGEEWLWYTSHGRPLSRCSLNGRISKLYRPRLSRDVAISLYRLRHSCATHLLRYGASVRQVQELLGHRAINSTQVYTKVALTDLQTIHRKYHPRSSHDREG